MPSGCRMGICYGCVVPLKEGTVRDLRNGDLTIAADGITVPIQTCINAAAGPLPPRPLTTSYPRTHTDRPTRTQEILTMTALKKVEGSLVEHLTTEDIEQLGRELDEIREQVIRSRGSAMLATSAK